MTTLIWIIINNMRNIKNITQPQIILYITIAIILIIIIIYNPLIITVLAETEIKENMENLDAEKKIEKLMKELEEYKRDDEIKTAIGINERQDSNQ